MTPNERALLTDMAKGLEHLTVVVAGLCTRVGTPGMEQSVLRVGRILHERRWAVERESVGGD
jgi:hypothetical protein